MLRSTRRIIDLRLHHCHHVQPPLTGRFFFGLLVVVVFSVTHYLRTHQQPLSAIAFQPS
ncbi:MAG: hypothetical protein WBA76_10435 [Phormidesmis sp.]